VKDEFEQKKGEMKGEELQTEKSLSFEAAPGVGTLLIYPTDLSVTLRLLRELFDFASLSIHYGVDGDFRLLCIY
jgi:hypothetical protein